MMSPFTLTSTCSIISARIGTTRIVANTVAAAKSCFFIIFNILAYPDTLAQVSQQAGNPAEDSPFGPGVFRGRPEDLIPGEAAGDLTGGRPRRPPRRLRRRSRPASPA